MRRRIRIVPLDELEQARERHLPTWVPRDEADRRFNDQAREDRDDPINTTYDPYDDHGGPA